MKKDENNCSKGRTRSLASASTEKETSGLRRSSRGIIPSAKPIAQTSGTRKSERLSPSVTKKPGRVEKKTTASPLRRSYRGKNLFPESSKGSDKNAEASSSIEKIKKEVTSSLDDEELVVVGGSHRLAADNDDARDDNSSPQTDSESERLPVAGNTQNSLEKGTVLPVKLVRDTSPLVETGIGSDTGLPTENSETQKLMASKPSLESDKDMSLKRKRDTTEIVMDACAIAAKEDDRIMGSDEAIPSPSSSKIAKQPERCATCEKWIKVNSGFADQSVCSCIAQQVQESDPVEQIMKDSAPASRDFEEKMLNMQQDKSSDKLPSMYPEYWVPVQLSDVQLEQYCRTLFSQSLSLSSMSKKNLVGALEETLTSVRNACDHPYVMDASLKLVLTKNLELHEILDVEVKASGKLHLLDAMLTQIKTKGLKAVVLYQATKNPGGILLANILEDFVSQRFGQNSYEHGVCHSTKNAIKNFNKESQCFVLLLETRACSQSTKLLRAEAFILFGSSLNPLHDVKLLQKIKIESYSERTKIFRLYSTFTVEEKALILARQNKPPENLNCSLTHALLMWGAVDLFDKLDTPDSGVQSIKDGVIHEFSSILSARDGEENKGKTCLLLEAKQAQGTYSSDSTLYGEERVKFSGKDSPHVFWTKLLGGKNPVWKYCSDTPQRSRKRVTYLEGSKETAKIDNGGTIKKRKKASEDITVDDEERKASEKYHMGDLDSPKVIALKSSHSSASGTKSTMNGNDGFGLHIYGVPEDMLAGIDWSQIPRESQRNLHDVLKPEMAKLCQVLHLSEYSTSMVEKFLQYIIENHRVCKEPVTTLQAFQIALGWIAALLVEQKLNREESLVRAKSDLAFNCCKEEVDYIYSMLYCMKSLFLERTQGLQLDLFDTKSKRSMVSTNQLNESLSGTTVGPEKNNTKLMRSSEGEECMTVRTGDHNSSARKDIERALTYIKKECKKRLQNHTEKHDEKKLELMNMFADKKQKLETEKVVECAIIRIQCRRTSTQSFEDAFKRLDYEHERKIDAITSERDEKIKRLEQMHEAEKKKLAEDEAYWISRVDKWAQAELINCAPISGSNKYFSGICSSSTSKNAHDVQTCNDSNVELALPMPHPASVVETIGSTESDQDDQNICPMPSLPASKQSDPAENIQGQNKQAEIESLPGGSPSPSSAAGQQPDPAANIQGQNKQASIESLPGGSSSPSSVAGQQPDPAANIQGQNIDAAFEPQPAGLETVETGGFAALEQGDQVACPLPSSPAGNQPVSGANIEGQDINTSAGEPHIAGQGAVEIGDSAVSDQEITGARNACSLPSSLAGTQADITANTGGQNITTLAQRHTAVSDQGLNDASPLTFSSPGDHPDAAAHIEELNNTTMTESQTTLLDACEMEITEPDPQVVEQSIFANNGTQHVHEGGVESSAGVAAPVPSLHDNGTGQSAYQPVPQIPFPVFSDPFQHELEKLRRESEKSKKAYEEKQLTLKAERERKIAEIEEEYQRKSHEVEAQHTSTTIDIETRKNLVIMNKLFSSAFLCKCTNRNPSHPSVSPRGQLAQRAAQVTAPRSFPAPSPTPAPIQPRATSFPSSVSRPSGHPLNSTHGSIPQPRPSLISITTPSLSAFPATNPPANARLRCSSAPHVNPYRPPSSVPVPATRPTSPALVQHVTYSTVTTQQQHEQQQQQQQQQQNLGSGLQSNNDVVYLSDDE